MSGPIRSSPPPSPVGTPPQPTALKATLVERSGAPPALRFTKINMQELLDAAKEAPVSPKPLSEQQLSLWKIISTLLPIYDKAEPRNLRALARILADGPEPKTPRGTLTKQPSTQEIKPQASSPILTRQSSSNRVDSAYGPNTPLPRSGLARETSSSRITNLTRQTSSSSLEVNKNSASIIPPTLFASFAFTEFDKEKKEAELLLANSSLNKLQTKYTEACGKYLELHRNLQAESSPQLIELLQKKDKLVSKMSTESERLKAELNKSFKLVYLNGGFDKPWAISMSPKFVKEIKTQFSKNLLTHPQAERNRKYVNRSVFDLSQIFQQFSNYFLIASYGSFHEGSGKGRSPEATFADQIAKEALDRQKAKAEATESAYAKKNQDSFIGIHEEPKIDPTVPQILLLDQIFDLYATALHLDQFFMQLKGLVKLETPNKAQVSTPRRYESSNMSTILYGEEEETTPSVSKPLWESAIRKLSAEEISPILFIAHGVPTMLQELENCLTRIHELATRYFRSHGERISEVSAAFNLIKHFRTEMEKMMKEEEQPPIAASPEIKPSSSTSNSPAKPLSKNKNS